MTECKYLSAIGKDQIMRYLDLAAYHYYSQNCKNVYFLLISNNAKEPAPLTIYRNPNKIEDRVTRIRLHVDYEKISAALANNIGWISWNDILQILEELLSARLTYSEKKIVQELVCYTRYKLGS